MFIYGFFLSLKAKVQVMSKMEHVFYSLANLQETQWEPRDLPYCFLLSVSPAWTLSAKQQSSYFTKVTDNCLLNCYLTNEVLSRLSEYLNKRLKTYVSANGLRIWYYAVEDEFGKWLEKKCYTEISSETWSNVCCSWEAYIWESILMLSWN